MNVPSELRYTEEHEWVDAGDDVATIGITDYAQGELGDVVYVELPEVGTKVGQMDAFGTIEAVKTVAELYAPVSGEIVEVNERLEDEPEIINSDPYGDGWMIRIRLENPADVERLLAADAYRALIS
jgi:glycine cleavage system H protein